MPDRSPAPAAPPRRKDTESHVDLARRLAPGTWVAGRYRILHQLGIGGMGVVYKARDTELDLDVALKVLRPDLGEDPGWTERFRRELLLARQVTHKNVVRIHDIGESDGLRFLSMAFVDGRPLSDVLRSDGPLPATRALHIFRQVAEALREAHAAGVVHRDLKPGNVLLAPDDTAYITDFGIARSLSGGKLTAAGVVVGTFDYLSPEQAAGDPVDARSDIYTLGIVLFEMLTGELPFPPTSGVESLMQRIGGHPRDVARTGVPVPAPLRRVLRRCLARNPSRRYESVDGLLADLDGGKAGALERLPRDAGRVLLALALAAGGFQAYRQRPKAGAAAGPPSVPPALASVAVLPLSDQTADSTLAWTSAGIAEILASELAEAPQLRVVDPTRVRRTLGDLQLTGLTGEPELRRLAEVLDVNRIVTGSVRRAGSSVRVELRLVTVEGDRIEARPIAGDTPTASGLFGLLAGLGDRLRRDLQAPRGPDRGPPRLATRSVEAAAAYREGRQHLLVGDSVQAAPAFERAVAADPRFAAALLDLSEARQALGQSDQATAAAEQAAALLESAETRLAWRARARRAQLRGDLARAQSAYAELVARYPHETEALLDLAEVQGAQGAVAEAAATLRRVTERDRADPRGWLLLGKNMIRAGDARRALGDPLVHALALMTQLGNEQGRGEVLNAMGVAHQRLGEYAQAISRYAEAATIRMRIGDQRGAAISLKNRGAVLVAMGQPDAAEPDLRAARDLLAKVGDRKGIADVWNEFGGLYEARGDYGSARGAYHEALRIRRELGDQQQLAQSYDNVGYISFLRGERDTALVYWRQALELRRKIGDKGGVVLSTQNMGFLHTSEGRWPEAMKSFLQSLELGREIDFMHAVAVSHGNIGLVHQYEGRYAAALSSYGEALRILEELKDQRGTAEFTIKQAVALIELGQLETAEQTLAAAAERLRATDNREQSSDLRLAQGEMHLARGDLAAAVGAFEEAERLADASNASAATLRARIARAGARAAAGSAAPAAVELEAIAKQAERLGDVVLRIKAAEALARAQLLLARPGEAGRSLDRALALAERCGWEEGLWRLHALRGRVREERGDVAGAAAAYRESVRRAARLREGLAGELRSSFGALPEARDAEASLARLAPALAPAR